MVERILLLKVREPPLLKISTRLPNKYNEPSFICMQMNSPGVSESM